MRIYKLLLVVVLAFAVGGAVFGRRPDDYRNSERTAGQVKYRDVCANSGSAIDQRINNVRARLLGGGDCWWNFTDGRYIVPKVDLSSGQQEVSSLYAGAVWIGGFDDFGNLKLACQDYRSSTQNDFWPGPLDPVLGNTEAVMCENWDRHFRVTGDEIRLHLRNRSTLLTLRRRFLAQLDLPVQTLIAPLLRIDLLNPGPVGAGLTGIILSSENGARAAGRTRPPCPAPAGAGRAARCRRGP